MIRSVYLAGPDVFLPNAAEIGEAKVALCRQHGLTGLFPLDNAVAADGPPKALGLAIYRANLTLMRRADAIIANLTPFRGPSADAGTVFELGFFAATGKPIYAYSSDRRSFARRTREFFGLGSGSAADSEGLAIEDFDLADNLMLAGAVAAAGGAWVTRKAAPGAEIAAFEAFADCLKAIDKAIAPAAQAAAAG